MKPLKLAILTVPLVSTFLLTSCSDKDSSTTTSSTTITSQQLTSSIGGKVTLNTINTQAVQSIINAQIEVVSLDSNGNQIDKKVLTTQQNGYFSVSVSLSPQGGKLIVSAYSEGFNKGAKTIVYNSPSEVSNLNISIELNPVKSEIISTNSINISAQDTGINNILKIAFFKDNNGITKTAVGDKAIKTLSTNNNLIMELGIPISKLNTNTRALKVSYRDFSPSNPDDYRNFPGEETTTGQELISFGFDWLDIRDAETGENPFINTVSSQLARDNNEYYRILRYVDCSQINKIKELVPSLDEDAEKAGIQFTFWAYDWEAGGWIEAGKGTFVNSPNIEYYTQGEDENTIDTVWDYIIHNGCVDTNGQSVNCNDPNDPNFSIACIDVNGDNIEENVSCVDNNVITSEADVCGTNTQTYVVVSVSNPSLEWKNLDYIKPATGQTSCKVTITNDEGEPISTYVEILPTDNSCIEYAYTYTSAVDGTATLNTLKFCNENLTGYIKFNDPINNQFTFYDKNNDGIMDEGDLVNFSENCEVNIQIKDINKCYVEGYVYNDDSNKSPRTNEEIIVHNDSWSIYRWGYTDEQGKYSIKVPCGQTLKLDIYYANKQVDFNVNGSLDANEKEDFEGKVILNDIVIPNNPPQGYGWLSTNTVKQGTAISVNAYVWDIEEDLPIKYEIRVLDTNGNEILLSSGSIEQNYYLLTETIDTATLNEGSYEVEMKLYQANDETKVSVQYLGTFTVYTQDIAPVIDYFYIYPNTISNLQSDLTLYGYAYDLDTDLQNLTSVLTFECYDSTGNIVDTGSINDGGNLLSTGIYTFKLSDITAQTGIDKCNIIWEVSDGTNKETENVEVYVRNNPPIVYIWTDSSIIPEGTTEITINAYIEDIEGDNISCELSVNGNTLFTDCSDVYTINLSNLNLKAGDILNITLKATDDSNNSSSAEMTLYYGGTANAIINIQ